MKRSLNMGKHTSSSPQMRKRLEGIFGIPGVERTILGRTYPCSHSLKLGHMKFRLHQPGKLLYSGYYSVGVVEVVVVIDKNSDVEEIKRKIALGNPC